eukprot:m51a1_g774 hypothetical protein (309) ;mRNA; r:584654-585654
MYVALAVALLLLLQTSLCSTAPGASDDEAVLTLLTTLKPSGAGTPTRAAQVAAVRSWCSLRRTRVVILGTDEGVPEVAAASGCATVAAGALAYHPEYRMPMLDSAVRAAETLGSTAAVGITNADVVYLDDLVSAVEALITQSPAGSPWLMVTRRWDWDVHNAPTLLPPAPGWQKALRDDVAQTGKQVAESAWAIDTYVWSRGFWEGLEVRPLMLGAPAWDNWLLHAATSAGRMTVDVSGVVVAVHQNHEYARQGARHTAIRKENERIADKWFLGNTGRTTHELRACPGPVLLCLAKREGKSTAARPEL